MLMWLSAPAREQADKSNFMLPVPQASISGWHTHRAMRDYDLNTIQWRRPPWRYLVLYLDRVTVPIISVILALAYLGLKSLF
jgi:hypothetical protein